MFRRKKAQEAKAYRVYSEPPATHCRWNRSASSLRERCFAGRRRGRRRRIVYTPSLPQRTADGTDPHLLCARDVSPEEGAEGEGVSCILRASRNALPTEQIRADQSLPDFSRDCTFVGRPQMLMKPADCAWSKSLSPKVTRFSEYRELGEVMPALIMLPL